jgi:hypothetical protein
VEIRFGNLTVVGTCATGKAGEKPDAILDDLQEFTGVVRIRKKMLNIERL